MYQYFSLLGLVTDIIGVLILFFTGLPPDLRMLDFYTEVLIKEEYKPIIKSRKRRSNIALGLIMIGFILQFIGTMKSNLCL